MSFDATFEFAATSAPALIPSWRRARGTGIPKLERHDRVSPQRSMLETFVRTEFLAHFGARVRHFMPELLALRNAEGGIRAVVGCRAAAADRLFLETYTREPIESTLARQGVHVPRANIVEIGNLACRNATAAIGIVRALVPYLLGAGYTWVVFTGADTIMNVFRHLGLTPRALCPADPLLLGDARHEWGSYYDHNPYVMGGRIADGSRAAFAPFASRPQ